MKNLINILLFLSVSFTIGCGEKGSVTITTQNEGPSTDGVPVIDLSDPDDSGVFDGRDTVNVDLKLEPNLSGYEHIELDIDIGAVVGNASDLDSLHGGDVVAYVDYSNGAQAARYFTSGGVTKADVEENFWYYSRTGKQIWRGVFEGPRGALIIVVDGVYKSGDGNDAFDYMSGSVWFRKWPVVQDTGIRPDLCYNKDGRWDCKNPSGPLVRCWKVSLGPYDCRFTISDDAKTVTAVGNRTTSEPYVKLGTFSDLSKQRTFKENY